MEFHRIVKDLEKRLTKKRFRHTAGVSETAKNLALRYGADPNAAELAGWVHDSMKHEKLPVMQALVSENPDSLSGYLVDEWMWESPNLLHGPAGAVFAATHYGITDTAILSAVACHTTGKPGMSLLDKILFLADYIEPLRDFPGVEEIRRAAGKNLDEACIIAYDTTIRHLAEEHEYLHPLTIDGRNDLILSWNAAHEGTEA